MNELFCCVSADPFGNRTDQYRHWFPTVYMANKVYRALVCDS